MRAVFLLFVVFMVLDCATYCYVVKKHGSQWRLWPGSGFYSLAYPKQQPTTPPPNE